METGKALSLFTLCLVGVVLYEIVGGGGFANCFWGLVGGAMIVVASILLL